MSDSVKSVSALVAVMLALTSCARRETMASRSAAAFRDSQKAGTLSSNQQRVDHSAMGHTMPMEHAATPHARPAVDHSAMGHAMPPQPRRGAAAMDHAAMGHGAAQTQPPAHAVHTSQPAQVAPVAPGEALEPSREIASLEPAATLRVDPQDAPHPVSVSEASRVPIGQPSPAAQPQHHHQERP